MALEKHKGREALLKLKQKPKAKRRNNEKRKEKSRDAARTRRSKETEIFAELGESLPIPKSEVDQLDKASIVRLAIAVLKVRDMVEAVCPNTDHGRENDVKSIIHADPLENYSEQTLVKALGGFILALSEEGDITYVTENIIDHLGLQQIDILSQPVWDYIHQCDHQELRNILATKKQITKSDGSTSHIEDLFLRFKCTITSRGRCVNIKSASYKVIHVKGRIIYENINNKRRLIVIGQPIPHPTNIEVLGANVFLTRHSLDMRFSYVDDKIQLLLNYDISQLMGKLLFDYHHVGDYEYLNSVFKCCFNKGQIETRKYRFLASNGGYAWVVTQATIVYDKNKPQSIICMNYMVSGIENEDTIYSIAQAQAQCGCANKRHNFIEGHQSTFNNIDGLDNHNTLTVFVDNCRGAPQKSFKTIKRKPNYCADSEPAVVNILSVNDQTVLPHNRTNFGVSDSSYMTVEDKIQFDTVPVLLSTHRTRSVTDALFAAAPEGLGNNYQTSYPSEIESSAPAQPRKETISRSTPINLLYKEDMSKEYMAFPEKNSDLAMLKEEVDDLSNLAPTPGEACIPLDETSTFLASYDELNDLIDSYIMRDEVNEFESTATILCRSTEMESPSYFADSKESNKHHPTADNPMTSTTNKTLSDPIISHNRVIATDLKITDKLKDTFIDHGTFTTSGIGLMEESKKLDVDPFMAYRHASTDHNAAKTDMRCSTQDTAVGTGLPSPLCSSSENLVDDDLAFMTSMNIEDDIDLSMRAPYISMSEADDLPLLISDDLMWGAIQSEVSHFQNVDPKLDVTEGMSYMSSPMPGGYSPPTKMSSYREKDEKQTNYINPQNNTRRRSYATLEKDEENGMLLLSSKLFPSAEMGDNVKGNGKTPIFRFSHESLAKNNSTSKCGVQSMTTLSDFLVLDRAPAVASTLGDPIPTIDYGSNICTHSTTVDRPLKKKIKKDEFISSTVNENLEKRFSPQSKCGTQNDYISLKNILCSPIIRKSIDTCAKKLDIVHNAKRMRDNDCSTEMLLPMILEPSTLLDQLITPLKSHKPYIAQEAKLGNQGNNIRLEKESRQLFKYTKPHQPQTQQPDTTCNSVLMNLLVSGCDMSAGYTCLAPLRPRKTGKV